MKLSITPISLSKTIREERWTLERFLGYAAGLGADGVDLLHGDKYPWLWQDRARDMRALPGWLDKAGLKLAAFAAGNNFAQSDPAAFDQQVAMVHAALREAGELGAPVLRIFGGHHEANGGEKGMTTAAGLPHVMRGIERCLAEAEKRRVVLALENHGRLPGHAYEVDAILRAFDSPWLRATFDAANFMGSNMDEKEDALHAYGVLRGRIAHVHVKDLGPSMLYDRRQHGYVAGMGIVPLRQLAAALEADGYAGYCSLEYEAGMVVPEPFGVPQSMAYLASIRAIHQALNRRPGEAAS